MLTLGHQKEAVISMLIHNTTLHAKSITTLSMKKYCLKKEVAYMYISYCCFHHV